MGYRQFFNAGRPFRPYASIRGGFQWVDSINLDLRSNGSSLTRIKFYDSTLTYAVGLGLGFRYEVAEGVALGLETGVRYEGDLSDDDGDLAGLGRLARINDAGDRLVIPLLARIAVQF